MNLIILSKTHPPKMIQKSFFPEKRAGEMEVRKELQNKLEKYIEMWSEHEKCSREKSQRYMLEDFIASADESIFEGDSEEAIETAVLDVLNGRSLNLSKSRAELEKFLSCLKEWVDASIHVMEEGLAW